VPAELPHGLAADGPNRLADLVLHEGLLSDLSCSTSLF
jgi:hypothetical protein